jgi:meiotically up-regulated gene 157 (Mug157) protein
MIPEDFLHYIWQHKLFYTQGLTTTDNENVEVIDTGIRNTNAGPDFFNAKIKIDNKTWAGNVEIHLQLGDFTYCKKIRHNIN